MSKIKELQAEIDRLKQEEIDSLKNKYQHLVGMCFSESRTCYEKITSIERATTDDFGTEVTFDCICIYFDNRSNGCNSEASIALDSYDTAYVKTIEKNIISDQKFNEIFDTCVGFMKKRIQINK